MFIYPMLEQMIGLAKEYAEAWKDISYAGKNSRTTGITHSSGKRNDGLRLPPRTTAERLKTDSYQRKIGKKATGNFNAHHLAYPEYDWKIFGARFLKRKFRHRT